MFFQNYNPFGNVFWSTLVAAVPIAVLLYFIAIHPHRDKDGTKHLGIAAPYAAFGGVVAAFLISCLVFRMPVVSAVSAFAPRASADSIERNRASRSAMSALAPTICRLTSYWSDQTQGTSS